MTDTIRAIVVDPTHHTIDEVLLAAMPGGHGAGAQQDHLHNANTQDRPGSRGRQREKGQHMTDASIVRSPERREPGRDRPRVPHTAHLRELEMPDGRRLLLDRRSIAFLAEAKAQDFDDKQTVIVAFRSPARPCPVLADYDDLKRWWCGGGAPGKAQQ
ncbi:MAG TPA: hypothetical protein VNK52_14275 [Hyphomicrobiaceae bacterium]|nr:hypothetical protein [Hyphomicrobiaceae bacterium]